MLIIEIGQYEKKRIVIFPAAPPIFTVPAINVKLLLCWDTIIQQKANQSKTPRQQDGMSRTRRHWNANVPQCRN